MHRAAAFLTLAAFYLPALACGGRVIGEGGGGGQDAGDDAPVGDCPNVDVLRSGAACGSPGLACPIEVTERTCPGDPNFVCGDTTGECTCAGGKWTCELSGPSCECPPVLPPSCPPSSLVTSGDRCSAPPDLSCVSQIPVEGCDGRVAGYLACNCVQGQWSCPQPDQPICTDGGTVPVCPPADSSFANTVCSSPGRQCPGNPTSCDGALFYDAFECQLENNEWRWHDVAATTCAADAGVGD